MNPNLNRPSRRWSEFIGVLRLVLRRQELSNSEDRRHWTSAEGRCCPNDKAGSEPLACPLRRRSNPIIQTDSCYCNGFGFDEGLHPCRSWLPTNLPARSARRLHPGRWSREHGRCWGLQARMAQARPAKLWSNRRRGRGGGSGDAPTTANDSSSLCRPAAVARRGASRSATIKTLPFSRARVDT